MNFELKQHFQIESARFLPHLAKNHPCSRMHGHSFRIQFRIHGPLKQPEGWVLDYNEIQSRLAPILEEIDHRILNEVPGLENPTTENLCHWLFKRASALIPEICQVTIAETPNSECSFPTRPTEI